MDADFRLLSQMKRGEEEAIECFVRKYYPSILQYCHYHLQEIHDAEDLTQETFARFFASLDRYKHYGKAANYLYVIAGNLCRDHYRRQSELPLADLPEPADRPLDTLDTRLDLQDAFRVLPPEIQPAVLFSSRNASSGKSPKFWASVSPWSSTVSAKPESSWRSFSERRRLDETSPL
ncbi:MAG: RNA polymerase sigma factor [Evtepia gabavorous]